MAMIAIRKKERSELTSIYCGGASQTGRKHLKSAAQRKYKFRKFHLYLESAGSDWTYAF